MVRFVIQYVFVHDTIHEGRWDAYNLPGTPNVKNVSRTVHLTSASSQVRGLLETACSRHLEAIPRIEDLQSAWLLLRCCAAPRANHAAGHDAAVAACLPTLVGFADHPLPPAAQGPQEGCPAFSQLPTTSGGPGWPGRAFSGMQHTGHPRAARILCCRRGHHCSHAASLANSGCESIMIKHHIKNNHRPRNNQRLTPPGSRLRRAKVACASNGPSAAFHSDEAGDRLRKWQRPAAHVCDELCGTFAPASQARLLSQASPHASRCGCVMPPHADVIIQ